MNIIAQLQKSFVDFLVNSFSIDAIIAQKCTLALNVDENKQAFGDLSSSASLVLAKELGKQPRAIAQQIADNFEHSTIQKIEIAGPGFLNFFLTQQAFDTLAKELFQEKDHFFKPEQKSTKKINIEFVSANPTGPLHFGHGRGGIIGDVLANILKFVGYQVTKEFYINDAGSQIQKLGDSLKIRYQQACGMQADLPEDAYHGVYLIDIANELKEAHGEHLLDQPTQFFGDYAKEKLLAQIRSTLKDYGISFDVWFSEKTLHDSGAIDAALAKLKASHHLFEQDGALWFKSTQFGDDKDRVVRKKDGSLTYAAADIAYLENKLNRGHDELIFVLGQDHHSYAVRLKGLLKALGHDNHLDVILYQLVSIKEDGEQVRMSKRAGKIVSLQDIIDTVGRDVARYFYLNRKSDAQLEFDLNLALTHSDENPVYYIQYAYVRTGSILNNAQHEQALHQITAQDLNNLSPDDNFLIKKIVQLKEMLEVISHTHHTHLLAYYTHELAQTFNRYYNKNRVIDPENIPLSRARLALVMIMRDTLSLSLDLLGLSKPARM
jgi:arginyl-tRNA synthetase